MKTPEEVTRWCDAMLNRHPNIEDTNFFNSIKDYMKEQRPQGEWIKWNFKTFGAMGDWEYKCSNCEKVYGGEYNFCPNCGADMRKTESTKPDTFGCFNCKHNSKRVTESPCITCGEEFKNWVDCGKAVRNEMP